MSTVNLQRKVLQVAFLKIICPGILFFPKPLEELVFHENAFGNRQQGHMPQKMWPVHPKEQVFAVFYESFMLNVNMFNQIFFFSSSHTWALQGTSDKLTRTPTHPYIMDKSRPFLFSLGTSLCSVFQAIPHLK